MSSPILVIQESEIASVAENGKAVVVTLDNALEIEIPFEAGQAITVVTPILAGNKYQLVMSGNNGTWIIEDLTEAPLLARKAEIEALVPSASPSEVGGATDTLQEAQIRCTINETIVPTNTNGATLLIGANPNRTVLTVFNNHSAVLWISSNNPAVVNTMRVPANSPISFDAPVPVDALYCRTQSGIGTALVVEGEAV